MITVTNTGYDFQGQLLEACSCDVLCPCWIGENPDTGACYAFNAYNFDPGIINGVDVTGLSYVRVVIIPGNVLAAGTWKIVQYVDERATPEQEQAILDAFEGRLGGPLADFWGLIGEVLATHRAPIEHETVNGKGRLRVGDVVYAEMEPYRGPDGTTTTLHNSLFSTIAGAPAYVSKAQTHTVNLPQYGMEWSYTDKNAIQSDYRFTHRP
jgi:hypothetical protein